MKKITGIVLALTISTTLFSQNITGSRSGKLNAGAQELSIVFNFNKNDCGDLVCTLDSPDQGAYGIPAIIDFLAVDSIAVNIPDVRATFRGKIKGDVISGIFEQMGYRFDLKLAPSPYERETIRPQNPKEPFPYVTEEIYFKNEEDDAVLCGTLSYPVGYEKGKPIPAVLMVTGSGQENRDEEIFGHKPFLVIADYLARHGIASLRYDDRGVGKSTGNVSDATSENFMKDALAGIRYLKSGGLFSRTGILGHSEGGMIAFMAAGKDENVDFIVSLAGSMLRGDKVLIYQNRVALSGTGLPAEQIGRYIAFEEYFFDFVRRHTVEELRQNKESYLKELAEHPLGAALPDFLSVTVKDSYDQFASPWMHFFISHDPARDIRRAGSLPILALNGTADVQVSAEEHLGRLQQLLPDSKTLTIKRYDGLNHLFQPCMTGAVAEYAKIETTISEEVLKDIAEWINGL